MRDIAYGGKHGISVTNTEESKFLELIGKLMSCMFSKTFFLKK